MQDTPGNEIAARLDAALRLACSGGEISLRYFRSQRYDIITKADGSPVTVADRETEQHLRRGIEEAFPEDGILGEEFPEKHGTSGYRWIIDPIDGTASFIHGVPLYGVLIGVERDRRSLAGVVHMPALGEMAYASRGRGAFFVSSEEPKPRPARVSSTASLKDACICTTGFEYYARSGRQALMADVGGACRRLRGWSDCYAHLLVATGRIDAVIDPVMNPWDSAASIVVVEEAGGRYTDFEGNATAHGDDAVISNALIHDELLRLIDDSKIPC